MPKVSVILTSYNHEKYLARRIESILAQTYTNYSIIIYDDCSTDNSRHIIEQYRLNPKIEQIIYNDTNSGNLYKQWEKGIANATGEWIWIAQSDDYADAGFLESLVGLGMEDSDIGIAFCGSHWINEDADEGADLSLYHESFFRNGLAEIRLTLGRQCSIQNVSAAIIRRDLAVKAIHGISEKYNICGDWIFYLRILHVSSIVYTNEKLNYFRWHHNNISNEAINNEKWIFEGITVLNNIDYKRADFSIKQFYLLLYWWAGIVFRSSIKNKKKLYVTLTKVLQNNILGLSYKAG